MQVKHDYDKARLKLQWRIRQLEQTKRDKLTPEKKKRKRSDSNQSKVGKSNVRLFGLNIFHTGELNMILAEQSRKTFEISSG